MFFDRLRITPTIWSGVILLQAGFQALPQLYDLEFQQVSVLLADYAVILRLHRRAQFLFRHGAGAQWREGHAPPVVPLSLAEYHAQGLVFPRRKREAVIAPRRISLAAKCDAYRPPLGGGFGGLCNAVGIRRDKLARGLRVRRAVEPRSQILQHGVAHAELYFLLLRLVGRRDDVQTYQLRAY